MPDQPGPGGAAAPSGGVPDAILRIGTWNLSHWTPARADLIAMSVQADVLAVQETHLAETPLVFAHSTARKADLVLHHGLPVPPVANSEHGKSCGVGFVVRKGIAVVPALPGCPAWRRLHAMRRLHGIRIAPRSDLPRGLLLLSVYAPLPGHAERSVFDAEFSTLVHALDMQVPTLLLGDFNGALCPADEYLSHSGARRPPCPLLVDLLGPGRPWVDVHRALLQPPLPFTYHHVGPDQKPMASRIDLILANAAAMHFVRSAAVQEEVRDGGHSPVLVTLTLGAGSIDWQPPQPRCPPLFYEPSSALAASA